MKKDSIIFKWSHGPETEWPLSTIIRDENDELNYDFIPRTPLMYKVNEHKSVVINQAGKLEGDHILLLGKVIEKLDTEVAG